MKPLDPRLLRTARAARWFIAGVVALAILGMSLTLLFAWQLSVFVSGVFLHHVPVAVAMPSLVILVCAGALRAGLIWGQEWLSSAAAAAAKSELRLKLLAGISKLGPHWLLAKSTAQLNLLATTQLDALDSYFAKFLPQLVYTALITPFFTVVIFTVDPTSGWALVATLPLIPLFMVFIGLATQSVQNKQLAAMTTLTTHFVEVMRGLTTLKVFGREEFQLKNIRDSSEEYRKRTMKVLRLSFMSGFALEVAASLSVALIAVSIGLRLVDGTLSLTIGLFVLLLAPEAYLPLRMVGAHFHTSADGVAASKAVLDIIDEAERATGPVPPKQPAKVPTFARGALTVVYGPSGSGKTSMLNQLRASLEKTQVAWLPQNVGLIPGSVRENIIGFNQTKPNAAALREALSLAGVDDLHINQSVGTSTITVSGGQAQRIGLARAFYRALTQKSEWLLLDEPVSALDEARANRISHSLSTLAERGITVVAVSHQPLPHANFMVEVKNA